MDYREKTIRCHERMAERLGCPLDHEVPILDFGCGGGDQIAAYRQHGYRAYGYDIVDASPDRANSRLEWFRFHENGVAPGSTRLTGTFRLPFEDRFFGFVFSEVALEHVMDYGAAFSEIARVLREGAWSLHTFPPRFIPVEPHVNVPFASVIRSYRYLLFWSRLGFLVRGPGQSATEAARSQLEYLENSTNYMSKSAIVEAAAPFFRRVEFADELYYRCWPGRSRILAPFFRALPALRWLHSGLRMRILLLQK